MLIMSVLIGPFKSGQTIHQEKLDSQRKLKTIFTLSTCEMTILEDANSDTNQQEFKDVITYFFRVLQMK